MYWSCHQTTIANKKSGGGGEITPRRFPILQISVNGSDKIICSALQRENKRNGLHNINIDGITIPGWQRIWHVQIRAGAGMRTLAGINLVWFPRDYKPLLI